MQRLWLSSMTKAAMQRAFDELRPASEFAELEALSRELEELPLLVLTCGTYGNVLRLAPPLVITEEEARSGCDLLAEAIAAATAAG